MLTEQFAWTYGSATGWHHLLTGKSNQDAWMVHQSKHPDALVVIVADGCSAMPHPEVGANLAVDILGRLILRAIAKGDFATDELDEIWTSCIQLQEKVIASFNRLVKEIYQPIARKRKQLPRAYGEVVERYMFFTVLAAVMTETFTTIISFGVGAFAINGEIKKIHSQIVGEKENPPYLSYHMQGRRYLFPPTEEYFHFQIQQVVPTRDVNTLLIGTDGLFHLINAAGQPIPGCRKRIIGPLSQVWEDNRFMQKQKGNFGEDTALNIWLRSLAAATAKRVIKPVIGGTLPIAPSKNYPAVMFDDTTLVVFRRIAEVS